MINRPHLPPTGYIAHPIGTVVYRDIKDHNFDKLLVRRTGIVIDVYDIAQYTIGECVLGPYTIYCVQWNDGEISEYLSHGVYQ